MAAGWKDIMGGRWLPLAAALIVGFAFQGSRGLFGTSESRYAECGREMAETGNYLEPTLGYQPHWTKPPMTYWAIAAGLKVTGRTSEWGARLFNAAAFVLTVWLVIQIGTRLYGEATGNLAGVMYATSLLPVLASWTITTDMLLTFWVSLAVWAYLAAREAAGAGRRHNGWVLCFWGALGLAFFTKGPPALLILLPIGVFHARARVRPRLSSPVGWALFLVLAFWWFWVVCLRHPHLLGYFLGTEIVGRVTSQSVHNHAFIKAFKVYVPALTGGLGGWLGFAVYGAAKTGLFRRENVMAILKRSEAARFLFFWLALPLAVFFLSSSKLPLYVLPMFAPLCIGTAVVTERLARRSRRVARAANVTAAMSILLLVGLKAAAPHHEHRRNVRAAYELCRPYETPGTLFCLVQTRSWGLQFYLDGNVVRLTDRGDEPWADGRLRPVLIDMYLGHLDRLPRPRRDAVLGLSQTNTPKRAVFIYQPRRRFHFPELLARLRRPMTCATNRFWGVCAVELDTSKPENRPIQPQKDMSRHDD